jgi:hypothetical protein
MAQPIKYNAGSKTLNCCIKKGYYDIGVIPSYAYGPTSSSGFYAGYTIPSSGGFVSYQNKASQGPSIYSIPSVNDLVAFGENLNIGSQTTPEDVIYACRNTDSIALVNIDYIELPSIDNNILTLDPGYTASYPWKNSDWYDISGNGNSGVLTGATYFSTGSSIYNYSDGRMGFTASTVDSMVLVPAFASALNTFTVNIWINYGGNGYNTRVNVIGQQYSTVFNGYTPQDDCNFLIRGNGSNGYTGLIRVSNSEYTVQFGGNVPGWNMLTLTYDGYNLDAYVNGTNVDTLLVGFFTGFGNGLQTIIGGTINACINENSTRYFEGSVNAVNIYDIALSSGEISSLYNQYSSQRGF